MDELKPQSSQDVSVPYLDKLLRSQTYRSYSATGLTLLLIGFGVGLPVWLFNRVLEAPHTNWEKTVQASVLAIAMLGFVWQGVKVVWGLHLAWGRRSGQLEDLKLVLLIHRAIGGQMSQKELAELIMSLRRDAAGEKDKPESPSVVASELVGRVLEALEKKKGNAEPSATADRGRT